MSWMAALGSAMGGAASGGIFGSWDGGWSTYSSGKSRTKYAAETALRYGLQSLEQSPSAARKGLEDAGFNPLLAIGNGIGQSSGLSGAFSEPNSSAAAKLDLEGLKGMLGKEKKEIAQNEVKKGEETNELIKAQKENVLEETRGKKIDNDLKGVKTAVGATAAAGGVLGGGAAVYKAIKSAAKPAANDGGWDALLKRSAPSSSAKAAKFGSSVYRWLGPLAFLSPAVVESFKAVKRGYDEHKNDSKKLERFVRQQFLGVH